MKSIKTPIDDGTRGLLQDKAVERGASRATTKRQMQTAAIKRREERTLRESIASFTANDRLSCDRLHERRD